MFKLMAITIAVLMTTCLATADVQWSRLRGKVKGVNGKTSYVTIQNREGDLLTVKVDDDVEIVSGKNVVKLKDLEIDDKVTLVYLPKAPIPHDPELPQEGGVYPPAKR